MPELLIGCAGNGALHHDGLPMPSVDASFKMVKESGVFDYYDRFPSSGEVESYVTAMARYRLPILAGNCGYTLKGDESKLEDDLAISHRLGLRIHNIILFARNQGGDFVTDFDVADFYLRAWKAAEPLGIEPCFEVHIDTWSEDFRRVASVAKLVEDRGGTFNITLDCSHLLFKIGNRRELEISGIREAVESGQISLDPNVSGNLVDRWLESGYVRHVHARAAAPNGPDNIWYRFPEGSHGRGIQYPFIEPQAGEWHSTWSESKLDLFKTAMLKILRYHATCPKSRIRTISTEFIARPHYGAGARYSMFENNVACARWLRARWAEILAASALKKSLAL
jgi:hypothetical protein